MLDNDLPPFGSDGVTLEELPADGVDTVIAPPLAAPNDGSGANDAMLGIESKPNRARDYNDDSRIAYNGVDPLSHTELFLPTIGVQAAIVETFLQGESWDVSGLGTNIGHLQGTSWLSNPGNIVLSGHVELRDGRAGIFANLDELNVGDPIILRENGIELVYTVTEMRVVMPDDLSVLRPTTYDQLTLITCGAYNFFQNSYQERIVAIAQPYNSGSAAA